MQWCVKVNTVTLQKVPVHGSPLPDILAELQGAIFHGFPLAMCQMKFDLPNFDVVDIFAVWFSLKWWPNSSPHIWMFKIKGLAHSKNSTCQSSCSALWCLHSKKNKRVVNDPLTLLINVQSWHKYLGSFRQLLSPRLGAVFEIFAFAARGHQRARLPFIHDHHSRWKEIWRKGEKGWPKTKCEICLETTGKIQDPWSKILAFKMFLKGSL